MKPSKGLDELLGHEPRRYAMKKYGGMVYDDVSRGVGSSRTSHFLGIGSNALSGGNPGTGVHYEEWVEATRYGCLTSSPHLGRVDLPASGVSLHLKGPDPDHVEAAHYKSNAGEYSDMMSGHDAAMALYHAEMAGLRVQWDNQGSGMAEVDMAIRAIRKASK